MYKRLMKYLNHYVLVEQRQFQMGHWGKLIDIDENTLLIKLYSKQGVEEGERVVPLGTITGVSVGTQELKQLALKVKWNESPDEVEAKTEEEEASPSEDKTETTTVEAQTSNDDVVLEAESIENSDSFQPQE